jgi:hypothetical protein
MGTRAIAYRHRSGYFHALQTALDNRCSYRKAGQFGWKQVMLRRHGVKKMFHLVASTGIVAIRRKCGFQRAERLAHRSIIRLYSVSVSLLTGGFLARRRRILRVSASRLSDSCCARRLPTSNRTSNRAQISCKKKWRSLAVRTTARSSNGFNSPRLADSPSQHNTFPSLVTIPAISFYQLRLTRLPFYSHTSRQDEAKSVLSTRTR